MDFAPAPDFVAILLFVVAGFIVAAALGAGAAFVWRRRHA